MEGWLACRTCYKWLVSWAQVWTPPAAIFYFSSKNLDLHCIVLVGPWNLFLRVILQAKKLLHNQTEINFCRPSNQDIIWVWFYIIILMTNYASYIFLSNSLAVVLFNMDWSIENTIFSEKIVLGCIFLVQILEEYFNIWFCRLVIVH